jgi:hypothetical protein
VSVTWDQLQEGDVLHLPKMDGSEGFLRIQLLETCRSCQSREIWNQVCVCGSTDCPRSVGSINVRKVFENPGIRVMRGDEEVGRS